MIYPQGDRVRVPHFSSWRENASLRVSAVSSCDHTAFSQHEFKDVSVVSVRPGDRKTKS